MISCRTPFRVSLFGGGTDFKEYFSKYNAYIVGGSINKYSYFYANSKHTIDSNLKIKLTYNQIENVQNISQIKHLPFKMLLKNYHNKTPIELCYMADLPGRSGIGSSSSFSVGAINILSMFSKKKISIRKLANESIKFERSILREPGGIQDQILCAHGGFNLIKIKRNGSYIINKLNLKNKFMKKLQSNLLLFYVGNKRLSFAIEKQKISKLKKNLHFFHEIQSISYKAYQLFKKQDVTSVDNIGLLLDRTWQTKKKLDENVTNSLIDNYYEIAKKNGALGGKLLGAGSGGFLMFYVPKSNQKNFRSEMNLTEIKFCFEDTGSKINEF